MKINKSPPSNKRSCPFISEVGYEVKKNDKFLNEKVTTVFQLSFIITRMK